MNAPKIDFDSRWKEIIEALFEDFVAFFFPSLYPDIDFGRKPVFLEQELHKLMAESSKKGKKINDKLIKVFTKQGKENAIFIHIEVEGSQKPVFGERMFKYFYRIFDKKKIPLTAIAIFIGIKHPEEQNTFNYNFHGTQVSYVYNTYRIWDQQEETLLLSDNPFALVVLTSLYVLKTNGKYKQRLTFKIQLLEILKKRNYSRKKIVNLFIFMRIILALPKELEDTFQQVAKSKFRKPKSDMLTLRPEDEKFIDELIEAHYGEGFIEKVSTYKVDDRKIKEWEEKDREWELKKQVIESQVQKLESQVQKLESKEKKLESKEQKIESEKQVIENEKDELKKSLFKTVENLYSNANFSPKEIASLMDIPETFILTILTEKGLLG